MLIEDTCTRRKTDPWAEEMQFCLKKGKRISCLRHMKASIIVTRHHSDQVIMQSPQGVEVKRNLQHLKPLAIPDSDYSTGDKPHQPDQLSVQITWLPTHRNRQRLWKVCPPPPHATLGGLVVPLELWKIMYLNKL